MQDRLKCVQKWEIKRVVLTLDAQLQNQQVLGPRTNSLTSEIDRKEPKMNGGGV